MYSVNTPHEQTHTRHVLLISMRPWVQFAKILEQTFPGSFVASSFPTHTVTFEKNKYVNDLKKKLQDLGLLSYTLMPAKEEHRLLEYHR